MEFLPSLKDEKLKETTSSNLELYFQHFQAKDNQVEFRKESNYTIFSTNIDNQYMNGIFFKSPDPDFETILEQEKEIFKNNFHQLWFEPGSDVNLLKNNLQKFKYRYIGDVALLGIETKELIRGSMPNSLYIEKINNEERLRKWIDVAAIKYNLRGNQVDTYFELFNSRSNYVENEVFTKYIGWLNGEPAATGTLIHGSRLSTIFDESILIHLTRKSWGIEDGITYKLVTDARDMGYLVTTVFCTVGEIRRYMALGFSEQFRFPKFVNMKKRR